MSDLGTRKTDAMYNALASKMRKTYRQAVHDMQAKLKDFNARHAARDAKYRAMVDAGKMDKADYNAWLQGQVFQREQWEAKLADLRESLYNADRQAIDAINNGKIDVFRENANYAGYSLEQGYGADFGFRMYDANTVTRLIKDNPALLPMHLDRAASFDWYNKNVQSAITQGIIQGESVAQIAKRICELTGDRNYKSALRNARTAYTGAQNAGRIEAMNQASGLGINVLKMWIATLDGHTRPAHQHLDGETAEINEPFESDLGNIDYPGDPNADPANVYNCRCTLGWEYPDDPQQNATRWDNEDHEVIDDMTYDEWVEYKAGL